MFHSVSCPVTVTVVPRSRRQAARTVANASGRISSSTAAVASRSWPSTPPDPSAPPSSRSIRSRSSESLAWCFRSRNSATCAASASVRSRIVARNLSVWARSSSSETWPSRSSCSLIASTMG